MANQKWRKDVAKSTDLPAAEKLQRSNAPLQSAMVGATGSEKPRPKTCEQKGAKGHGPE